MKKIVILILILLLFSSFIYIGTREDSNTKLEKEIIEQISKDSFKMSDLTDFEWDKIYVATPYTDIVETLEKEGIKIENKDYSIELLDTIVMFCFINDNEMVDYVELSLGYILFDLDINDSIVYDNNKEFEIRNEYIVLN